MYVYKCISIIIYITYMYIRMMMPYQDPGAEPEPTSRSDSADALLGEDMSMHEGADVDGQDMALEHTDAAVPCN